MGEGTIFQSLMQMLMAIIVVFGALFGLRHYLLRGAVRASSKEYRLLALRDKLQLGPRSFAYVIQAGREVFLVCTADNSVEITPLEDIEAVDTTATEKPPFTTSLYAAYEHLRQGRRK